MRKSSIVILCLLVFATAMTSCRRHHQHKKTDGQTEAVKEEAKKGADKAKKAADSQAAPAADAASSTQSSAGMSVADATMATAVNSLVPEGAGNKFSPGQTLYCFTKILGAAEPTQVSHVWSHNGNEVANVRLNVKSASWRTYSSKIIEPDKAGSWKVDVRGPDGKSLQTLDFTVE